MAEPKWCKQSTSIAASALITTGRGLFYGALVATDGTNGVSVDIGDHTTSGGTKLIPTSQVPSSATIRTGSITPPAPVRYENGLYVTMNNSGTAGVMVYYRPDYGF